jgi:2-amino-4-hydroxy-6-hydroxymethyldihydropteridine diphosphokinase
MHTVYLGLGSNIGDRLRYLTDALEKILTFMTISAISPVYETEPVGLSSGGDFFNIVVKAETRLAPSDLLPKLKSIEQALGRAHDTHMKPREIDIDVLLYENETHRGVTIEVPHPKLTERRFVLVPLNDLAPDLHHPLLNKTIKELLEACTDMSQVVRTIHKITIPQLT